MWLENQVADFLSSLYSGGAKERGIFVIATQCVSFWASEFVAERLIQQVHSIYLHTASLVTTLTLTR